MRMNALRWRARLLLTLLAWALGGQVMAQDGGSGGRGVGPMALQKAEQAKEEQGASTPLRGGSTARSGLSMGDRRFLQGAAASELFEVEAARLASSTASDPQLQRYAATLVEDHARANDDLQRLASAKGVQLPSRLPAARQRELDRMRQLKGEAFDLEFFRSVALREHQQDIRRFESARRNARDPELRAWAGQMLPVLERHLSQARQLPWMSKMPMEGPHMGPGMGMGGDMMGQGPGLLGGNGANDPLR